MNGSTIEIDRAAAWRGSRVLAAVTAFIASSCCEPSTTPCISWIATSETYEVEVLDQFELDGSASEADDPSPYSGYGRGQQSCGEGFDLSPGDKLTMTAIGTQQHLTGHQRRCGACQYIDADVSIDGITRLADDERGFGIGDARFADMFEAAVDEGCRGSYWIGIMPVEEYFLANSDRQVATDFMLFREFREADTEACRRPGSEISSAPAGCWDSWVVRIRDSSGELKTRELPHADATADATETSEDGSVGD